jgi:hypothetical protein
LSALWYSYPKTTTDRMKMGMLLPTKAPVQTKWVTARLV